MARNSLRTLSTGSPDSPAADKPRLHAGQLPEDIRTLLHERDTLEARMARLMGRGHENGDPRFPITPLPVRRAADAAWAAARDRLHGPGSPRHERDEPYDGRAAQVDQVDQVDQAIETAISEPAQRTGQRTIRAPASRTGLRALRGLDTTETEPLDRVPRLRDPTPTLPELRDLTSGRPEPRLSTADKPDALVRAAQRLDILRGGSGDLDELRALAQSRRAARRDDERGLERRRGQRDPDADRDAARLNGRGARARRRSDA